MPVIDIAELEIHYRQEGSGDTMLVFPDHLHSSEAYGGELSAFSDRFRVLSFDYPGTGQSTREIRYEDERTYDLWNFRADLACHLLLALEIDGSYAVGCGGGALAALHFAGRQAGLHGLAAHGVIADSFLPRFDGRTLHRSLDTREHTYVRQSERLLKQHGEDWRQVVDADTAFLRKLADRGGYALPDFVANAIACPVLLTGSLQDPVTPGIAEEYARISGIIPDCTVHLVSSARHRYGEEHPLMWTDARAFRAVSNLFLSRMESTG